MNRRKVLMAGGWALTGASLAAASEQQSSSTRQSHSEHHGKVVADCFRECESCREHCLGLVAAGRQEHLQAHKYCADCASFCAAATSIISRDGPFVALIAQSCAKACDRCATECEKFREDSHMKRCAEACRDCAKTCTELSDRTTSPGR
jgi:hypothetical protein